MKLYKDTAPSPQTPRFAWRSSSERPKCSGSIFRRATTWTFKERNSALGLRPYVLSRNFSLRPVLELLGLSWRLQREAQHALRIGEKQNSSWPEAARDALEEMSLASPNIGQWRQSIDCGGAGIIPGSPANQVCALDVTTRNHPKRDRNSSGRRWQLEPRKVASSYESGGISFLDGCWRFPHRSPLIRQSMRSPFFRDSILYGSSSDLFRFQLRSF